jgi:cytochrome c peroxidase
MLALLLGIGSFSLAVGAAEMKTATVIPPDLLAGYARPNSIPAPTNNPITPEKVALGRALFFETRLSRSGKTSCASCHDPSMEWQDGRPLAIGDGGTVLKRRTPTIWNVAWVEPLSWDGRAASLEEQARAPLDDPLEMNMPHGELVTLAKRDPAYVKAFAEAYPGQPITMDLLLGAIATFERTVVSPTTAFDRRVGGDRTAMNASAERGFILFNRKAGCASCHSGWRFTDDGFHDIGLPGTDLGRGKVVRDLAILQHSFKTPMLRNIAKRAPYMHDGSVKTLAAVIDFYNQPTPRRPSTSPEIKSLNLTSSEKADLIAFLNSLNNPDDDHSKDESPSR